jgi:hypothetical protein
MGCWWVIMTNIGPVTKRLNFQDWLFDEHPGTEYTRPFDSHRSGPHEALEWVSFSLEKCGNADNVTTHARISPRASLSSVISLPLIASVVKLGLQHYINKKVATIDSDAPEPIPKACWRQSCEGTRTCHEYVVGAPAILIFECYPDNTEGSAYEGQGSPWTYPPFLHLFEPDRDDDPHYRIVARIFHVNNNHFSTTYSDADGNIYFYDGISTRGLCHHLPDATLANSLCPPDAALLNLPSGGTTCAVIYVLEEGKQTQQRFYGQQTAALSFFHDIDVQQHPNRWPEAKLVSETGKWRWLKPRNPDRVTKWAYYEVIRGVDDDSISTEPPQKKCRMKVPEGLSGEIIDLTTYESETAKVDGSVIPSVPGISPSSSNSSTSSHEADIKRVLRPPKFHPLSWLRPLSPSLSPPPLPLSKGLVLSTGPKISEPPMTVSPPKESATGRRCRHPSQQCRLQIYEECGTMKRLDTDVDVMNCRCRRVGVDGDWVIQCTNPTCYADGGWSHLACYEAVGGMDVKVELFLCHHCWTKRNVLRQL